MNFLYVVSMQKIFAKFTSQRYANELRSIAR
jgi:hypothetical protein